MDGLRVRGFFSACCEASSFFRGFPATCTGAWGCCWLPSCSGFVFKLASGLLSLLAFAVLITYSVKNGIILLVLAFLISPMGLPMLAVQGLGKLQDVNSAMKNFIHS